MEKDSEAAKPNAHIWTEGEVDRLGEHIELRHVNDLERVAELLGPPRERVFPVRLLAGDPRVLADVRHELDSYLLQVGGPNPWAYAIYHCGTTSNPYSSVHWTYHPQGSG